MITIAMPEWFAILVLILLGLNFINGILSLYIKRLERKLREKLK